MAKVGGDVLEVSVKHTLGEGIFSIKTDEDSELDLGGYRTNDDEKSVDTGGNNIKVMTRQRWSSTFVVATDITSKADLDLLNRIAGSNLEGDWTITHISGAVYRGTGSVVGDVKAALKAATIQIKVAGGSIAKLVS